MVDEVIKVLSKFGEILLAPTPTLTRQPPPPPTSIWRILFNGSVGVLRGAFQRYGVELYVELSWVGCCLVEFWVGAVVGLLVVCFCVFRYICCCC